MEKVVNYYDSLKIKFLKIFANLPEKIKSEDIIVVVEDRPYTWNAAAIEVKNNTKTGEKIIKTLKDIKIL